MKAESLPEIQSLPRVVTTPLPVWPAVDEAIIENVVKVLRSESLSQLGKDDQVNCRFERAWAAYCGVNHALSCNGGTAALAMAVGACAGPGDEVIVPTYTWNASALAVVHANAIPVFADIDPGTYTVLPESIERNITSRTRAVITVHLFGHPCDMDAVTQVAKRHGLVVIEDAAQAHGATYKGRRVGSLGDVGCFSHQGSKNLPAGEGGTLVTNDVELFRRCVTVGAHPARQKQELPPELAETHHVGEFCVNYRMQPLAGAILEAGLPRLDERNAVRRRNAMKLYDMLSDVPGIRPAAIAPDVEHVFHHIPFDYRKEEVDGAPRTLWMQIARAKGAPVTAYVGTPLHLRARVQRHEYYGRGCPWECPFALPRTEPGVGHCPNAEYRCAETELSVYGACFWTECDEALAQLAQAFREASELAPRYAAARRA
ncbi:MAG: DegT/DnrJ/EryC1/StrS family aminotransferase [Lentisphaeria bacterium]|nr:DegT/DnrJ/EryC1/StrS family aminotransferase [Lentisphaeria bacterium]